jgi:hypothetical protein
MKRNLFLLLAVFLSASIYADENIRSSMKVDWEKMKLDFRLELDADSVSDNPAFLRNRAESLLMERVSVLFIEASKNFIVDSRYKAGELYIINPDSLALASAVNWQNKKNGTSISRDFSVYRADFSLDLYRDFGASFIFHKNPAAPAPVLSFVPSEKFTGMVIFAKGLFPVHGEKTEAGLQKALFPRIYDRKMNLVAEAAMADPAYLADWGFVSYSSSDELYADSRSAANPLRPNIIIADAKKTRTGGKPLKTIAAGVFGINRTDIIISEEAAKKLLHNRENEFIIREGRIVIICD